MGRQHDVLELEEGGVDVGLVVVHVETGAGDGVAAQRLDHARGGDRGGGDGGKTER